MYLASIKQSIRREERTKTILVVDDSPIVLDVIKKILSLYDYRFFLASSGEQALALTKKNNINVDLLLTDVIMPGMNGMELAITLKANQPKVKVIFMSGYTDDVIAHFGVLAPGELFIQKPIIASKLINKIRKMLDEQ